MSLKDATCSETDACKHALRLITHSAQAIDVCPNGLCDQRILGMKWFL